jgi:hypothetical protein
MSAMGPQVIGRNLKQNGSYVASAVCAACGGARVPLVEFQATVPVHGMAGCATAPQVLAFLKFNGVYDIDSVQVAEKA